MGRKNIPYQLTQEKTGKTLFEAAFVRYYPETPHCALFEDYPAERTKIWVCRQVDPQQSNYGYRLAVLNSHGSDGSKQIGYYVKLFEVETEQEAEERLLASLVGISAMRAQIYLNESREKE